MPATAYTSYVKTVDRLAVRLHGPEADTLRHAADAVFFPPRTTATRAWPPRPAWSWRRSPTRTASAPTPPRR